MKLMKITRANSLIVNLFYSLSFSSVMGYILMAAAWFISGMRLDLVQCSGLWIIFLVVLFIILGTICAVIDILKHVQLQKLADHRLTKGYDDEYFEMLRRFIGGELTDSQQLYFASSYLEGERCEDCREQLKKLNFKALDSSEQEEYFNICLYSGFSFLKAWCIVIFCSSRMYAFSRSYSSFPTSAASSSGTSFRLIFLRR